MSTTDPLTRFGTNVTPQTEPIPGVTQVENNQGGYVFEIPAVIWLRRFLTMGTAGGTFYVGQDALTMESGNKLLEFTKTAFLHKQLVDEIVEISVAGRAPKPNPALFALAIACQKGETEGKQYARSKINEVVRTGTHLFTFVGYLQQFGGWGRGLRKAVGNWYVEKDTDKLTLQLVKYRNRAGFTHRDVLRMAHPKIEDPNSEKSDIGTRIEALEANIMREDDDFARSLLSENLEEVKKQRLELLRKRSVIDWTLGKSTPAEFVPEIMYAFDYAQRPDEDIVRILETQYLPWEALPDSAMNDTKVWDKLLDNGMPITALVRQLSRLTQLGMLPPMGDGRTDDVIAQLLNPEAVKKSRIHPFNVLVAMRTYASGRGIRSQWSPSHKIIDALDEMFYLSFGNVEPSGKRIMSALDVSASMSASAGNLPLTCYEVSAAMAMVAVRTESNHMTTAFTSDGSYRDRHFVGRSSVGHSSELIDFPISSRQRLDDVLKSVRNLPHRGTDCALPMMDALVRDLKVDTFVVYTDNETAHGAIHPVQALQKYRRETGINAKLIVVSITPTRFSIADPSDTGMLDISGFDSAVPNLIGDFSAGRV